MEWAQCSEPSCLPVKLSHHVWDDCLLYSNPEPQGMGLELANNNVVNISSICCYQVKDEKTESPMRLSNLRNEKDSPGVWPQTDPTLAPILWATLYRWPPEKWPDRWLRRENRQPSTRTVTWIWRNDKTTPTAVILWLRGATALLCEGSLSQVRGMNGCRSKESHKRLPMAWWEDQLTFHT